LAFAVVFALLSGVLIERAMLWRGLGLLWIGLPCVGLVWLRGQPGAGLIGVFWLLACVWACDTGAYFAGKSIGGAKLAPTISPSKTWSGLIGGMLAAALVSIIFSFYEYTGSVSLLAVTGAVLAAVSQLGDLAESAVKRNFDVKDSGRLIPGHGGMLDRVDGLLFAVPAGVALMVINEGMVWAWH
jgi:phosphatidate cytidylyltransferase